MRRCGGTHLYVEDKGVMGMLLVSTVQASRFKLEENTRFECHKTPTKGWRSLLL